MYIGNLILLTPVLYLTAAAIAVLLLGVIAGRNPEGKVEHFFSAHYVGPALMLPGVVLSGGLVWHCLIIAGSTVRAHIGSAMVDVPAADSLSPRAPTRSSTMDPFAAIFSFVIFLGTLAVMLISIEHFGEFQRHKGEYYALLMFACVAASLTAGASDLIAIYLAVEFLSLSSYILAAYAKTDRRSAEAGLKYFLYGAACSAIMLYGMSVLFGVSGGNTSLSGISQVFQLSAERRRAWARRAGSE